MRVGVAAVLAASVLACEPRRPASEGTRSPAPGEASSGETSTPTGQVPAPTTQHYATLVRYDQLSSCSQSWSLFTSSASFVLDLEPDGSATACRGREFDQTGGGWDDESSHMRVREQQGFAGIWRQDGAWVDLKLQLDDGPCEQLRGYVNLEPKPWHLRCRSFDHSTLVSLPSRVFACQFVGGSSEDLGYATYGILDDVQGSWMVMGDGPGVEVRVVEDDMRAEPPTVQRARAPIGAESWQGRDLKAAQQAAQFGMPAVSSTRLR